MNKSKKGNSTLEVLIFFLMLMVLAGLQNAIIKNRVQELKFKEEGIKITIDRENDIVIAEEILKNIIIEKNIFTQEALEDFLRTEFTSKDLLNYKLKYDDFGGWLFLEDKASNNRKYYRVVHDVDNPKLIEVYFRGAE